VVGGWRARAAVRRSIKQQCGYQDAGEDDGDGAGEHDSEQSDAQAGEVGD
jgi:hypothetical protein